MYIWTRHILKIHVGDNFDTCIGQFLKYLWEKVDCKLCKASARQVLHSIVAEYTKLYLNRFIRVGKQEFSSFEVTIQI